MGEQKTIEVTMGALATFVTVVAGACAILGFTLIDAAETKAEAIAKDVLDAQTTRLEVAIENCDVAAQRVDQLLLGVRDVRESMAAHLSTVADGLEGSAKAVNTVERYGGTKNHPDFISAHSSITTAMNSLRRAVRSLRPSGD